MARSSIIGQLRVVLGLDSAQFDTGLTRAQGRMRSAEGGFRSSAQSLLGFNAAGLVAGVTVASLATALIGAARATAQYADDLDAAATRIGVTAEQLQELRHAAGVADISTDKLDDGLRNLNSTLGAMQTGVGNARLKDAFKFLDITPDQLAHLDNAAQLLPLLADRISKLGTQAEQVAIARRLKIEDLLPLLQRGGDGVRALTAEMQNLGELSNEEVTRAADLNEEMRVATERFENAKRSLTIGLLPALTWLVKLLGDAAQGWRGLFDNNTMHNLAVIEADAQKKRDEAGKTRNDRELAGGVSPARRAQLESEQRAIAARIADANRVIMTGPTVAAGPRAADHVTADPPLIGGGGRRGPTAQQLADQREAADIEERRRLQAADRLNLENQLELARARGDKEAAFGLEQEIDLQERVRAMEAQGIEDATSKAVLQQGNLLLARSAALAAADRLAAEEKTTTALAAQKAEMIEQKNLIAAKDAAAAAELKDGLLNQAAKTQQLYDDTHAALAGSIEDAFYAAADGNLFDYFAKRLKQALIGNIADGLATALMGGPSGAAGGNGSLLALGAHFLGLPGFANGGRIKVGGGGGTDSQLVAFRATPGELVDINPPGNDNGAGGARDVRVHVDVSPLLVAHIRQGDMAAAEHGASLAAERMGLSAANRVY